MFHSRSFEIFTPNSFALDTTSFFTINDNGCSMQGNTQFFKFSFVELKFVSSCLSFFNSSTDDSILLVSCFHTFSAILWYHQHTSICSCPLHKKVVYRYNEQPRAQLSLPTYSGWDSTTFRKSLLNFTRCLRSFRESTIHSIMLCGISKGDLFRRECNDLSNQAFL